MRSAHHVNTGSSKFIFQFFNYRADYTVAVFIILAWCSCLNAVHPAALFIMRSTFFVNAFLVRQFIFTAAVTGKNGSSLQSFIAITFKRAWFFSF